MHLFRLSAHTWRGLAGGAVVLALILSASFAFGQKKALLQQTHHMSAMGHLARQLQNPHSHAFRVVHPGAAPAIMDWNNPDGFDSSDGGGEEDGYTENPFGGGQAETSIAVDSTGQHMVVGINDTRGFNLNPTSVSGY